MSLAVLTMAATTVIIRVALPVTANSWLGPHFVGGDGPGEGKLPSLVGTATTPCCRPVKR